MFEFNQLCRRAASTVPTERERVRRFVKGLRMEIQRYLLSQTYPDLREALAAASRLERVSGFGPKSAVEGSSKGSSASPVKVDRQKRKDVPEEVFDVRPLRAMDPQGRMVNQDVSCYECGKKGHKRNQCYRLSGGCFRCGETSHWMADCPRVQRQEFQAPGNQVLPQQGPLPP